MRSKSLSLRCGVALALGVASAAWPIAQAASVDLPPVSVGAGLRTSFISKDYDDLDADSNDFEVESARIYLSGKVTDDISLMFNTEYDGTDEKVRVMDAAAQFAFSDQFNIWAGRFLPPSDRANLYGPYYASHWGVFQDGVQDGYPFETAGRADGVMYWGQFGIAKVSAGVFDVPGTKQQPGGNPDAEKVLGAARVQLDFWDPEGGYYLNGTYYGEKDLLAVGVAGQVVDDDEAYSIDFLLEKKLASLGVVTVEAEYAMYDGLGGYGTPIGGGYDKEDGWYALAGYLFPQEVGIGKFQVLAKYGEATYDFDFVDLDQETLEVDLNYLIKSFNARVSLFYIDQSFDPNIGGDVSQIGLGLQVQM
ncbi:MAG TPA: porin [Steroidobacteraceae bacterium]|nr:porin [Steroidobacteraceae bacterium]